MTPEGYPDTPAFREAAAARRSRDDTTRFEAFQRILDTRLDGEDVPVTPGYPQGRPLQVCPACRMKAPIRACGCVLCDLLGLRPTLAAAIAPERRRGKRR